MNRALFSTFAVSSRCAASPSMSGASRRYASTEAAGAKKSSNLASILLAVGVVSAGGYYYLSKTSPETIAAAERAVSEKTGVNVSGTPHTTNSALDPNKWVSFKLKEVKPYNYNTSRFVFELPEGTDSGLTVASALLMKPVVEGEGLDAKGKPAIRPYTPITMPNEKGHMDFLIKKYPGGALTQYIHSLKPGAEIAFKGPLPKHAWKANEFESIGMVAGGTGITPMWQVIQAIDSNPSDKTKVTLLFANVSEKDVLIKDELESLAKRKPEQFKIVHVLEKPEKSWKGLKGFVGHDSLAQNLPLPGLADKTKIFVCGPPPMVEVVCGNKTSPKDQGPLKGYLADLGYQPSQIYKF